MEVGARKPSSTSGDRRAQKESAPPHLLRGYEPSRLLQAASTLCTLFTRKVPYRTVINKFS